MFCRVLVCVLVNYYRKFMLFCSSILGSVSCVAITALQREKRLILLLPLTLGLGQAETLYSLNQVSAGENK